MNQKMITSIAVLGTILILAVLFYQIAPLLIAATSSIIGLIVFVLIFIIVLVVVYKLLRITLSKMAK